MSHVLECNGVFNGLFKIIWRISSAGRASALQAEGHRFEPYILHHIIAGWSSLVARRAHNPKVVGSNPAPAIKN